MTKTPRRDTARNRAWIVMRAFGQRREEFTVVDLAARVRDEFYGKADPSNLQVYCRRLEACGYLKLTGGSQGHDKTYRLVRDTGPVCPMLRRVGRAVYDPNEQREYCPGEPV